MAGPGNHQTQRFTGAVTVLPGQNLWRHVLDGAAERVRHRLLVDRFLAQPEVGQLHVAVGVEQDVLGL